MDRTDTLQPAELVEAKAIAKARCTRAWNDGNDELPLPPACLSDCCLSDLCERVRIALMELCREAPQPHEKESFPKKRFSAGVRRSGGRNSHKDQGSRASVEEVKTPLLADEQGDAFFLSKMSLARGVRPGHGHIIGWGCYWKKPLKGQ